MLASPTLIRVLALALAGLSNNGLTVRADSNDEHYAWTFTWTGPKTCDAVPCPYSKTAKLSNNNPAYNVSGPGYTVTTTTTTTTTTIPSFAGSCAGTVDEPLARCEVGSGSGSGSGDLAGNFSSYETSGVGAGQIVVALAWVDEQSGAHLTLTGVTPLQASAENHNTWEAYPTGCPLMTTGQEGEDCAPPAAAAAASNASSSTGAPPHQQQQQKGRRHRTAAEWWRKGY
ncbi:hypothetical protein F5X96DRAFT_669670 [Biscogniauxia mediterranea]|nr:hypothetical protein F5X96DRAFT_669670 [Biscogniauxia mediterranea]